MSLRCGCPDASDDVVFGPCRKCISPRPLDHAPTCPLVCCTSANDPAVVGSATLSPPEPRYMDTLDEMERGGH